MKPLLMLSINTSWNLVNFRSGLIRHLQSLGFRVATLSPPDHTVPALKAMGCEVVELPMAGHGTNPLQDFALWWRYRQILRDLRPVAFLGWTIKPNIYGTLAARSLGIPTINNVSGLGSALLADSWLSSLALWLYRIAFRRSRVVFFQNPDDRIFFLQHRLVRTAQAGLLPGSGIDLVRFSPAPRAHPSGRPFRFLMIARLLRDKGVMEYVEAARRLRRAGSCVECCFLGFVDVANPTAISRVQLEAWVEEGAIVYLGSTEDVRPMIALADAVVLPSYREGTSRTLLEAAAMARPIIASDVPGCRDVVDHEKNGYLCEPRDAESLLAAMQRMMELSEADWRALSAASRRKAETTFDERRVLAAYEHALLFCLPGSGTPAETRGSG